MVMVAVMVVGSESGSRGRTYEVLCTTVVQVLHNGRLQQPLTTYKVMYDVLVRGDPNVYSTNVVPVVPTVHTYEHRNMPCTSYILGNPNLGFQSNPMTKEPDSTQHVQCT